MVTLVLACRAQTIPTIKGHTLGESVQVFLDNSTPETKMKVEQCRKLFHAQATGQVSSTENDSACDHLETVLLNSDDPTPIPCDDVTDEHWCKDFPGEVTFEAGKLVSIKTTIFGPWSQAYSTLVKKFGKPTAIQGSVLENGFGAKFHATNGFWVAKGYKVTAQESLDADLDRYVQVEVITSAYARERTKEIQKHNAGTLD